MRVFAACLVTETNTFSPLPTGLSSFRDRGYFPAGAYPDHLLFYAGPVWAARQRAKERGWILLEGMVASAQPAGATTRAAYEELRDELLSDLRKAMPVDLVVLGLHGAMVAHGYPDCEGDILARVRAIVGPRTVIGVELDPHCHLSDTMIANSDLIICFKEYPHTDVAERAFELVDLCAAQVQGKIRPVPSMVDCEMIVTMHTTRQPVRGFVDHIQKLEGQGGILSISVAHGFAWGDTPDMGTKVLVYSDADKSSGDQLARTLADELIGMREQLQAHYPDVDTALDQALSVAQGPVVMADSADNPGGGAAGDSTFILHRILARGIVAVVLGPLWDPVAVRIAFDAGVGATLSMRVGGKTGPMSGAPVDAEWEVIALVRNMQMSSLSGGAIDLGDCACIRTSGVSVVLTTLRNQALGTDLFTQIGCVLEDQRIVVVKSSQHFHAAFAPLASAVIYVSAPGSVPIDLSTLDYKNVRQPKWPLKCGGRDFSNSRLS